MPAKQVLRALVVTPARILLVSATLWAHPAQPQDAEYREGLRIAVERIRYGANGEANGINADSLVASFYERRSYLPAWRDDPRRIDSLVALVADAFADGLDPADYHHDDIAGRNREPANGPAMSPAEWASFELVLTDALISLIHHQRFGKADPLSQDARWNLAQGTDVPDSLQVAEAAMNAPSLREFIEERIPRGPYYRRLRATLAKYRGIVDAGGWPVIAEGPRLEYGSADERVAALATRLAMTGDLDDAEPYASSGEVDAGLVGAIRRYQERHALESDGIVGPATLRALNTPAERRVQQLRLTLERARWVLAGAGDSFIAVNIAGFRVYIVADRQIAWESRVVVGKAHQQTPVFRDELQYIVFNPSWNVPYSIATREMLPEIQAQPDWFETHDYDIRDSAGSAVDPSTVDWAAASRRNFQYSLVQRPGPNNALGQVKFIFPNEHAVYLHDTPARQLFSTAERAFSHGCIRVENPLELAEFLLRANGWDRKRIDAAVASGKTSTVYLAEPMPILLLYWTASVDPDGVVHFYRDIYERDPPIAAALDGPFRIGE